MAERDVDFRVRLAAFRFLDEQARRLGEVFPHGLLSKGFVFEGRRVPLIGLQGIFKPAVLPELPLSITTAPVKEGRPRPYDDELGDDGLLRYRYRGTDPHHRDNVTLRLAMERKAPLIYHYGIVPGLYFPAWPAYVVGDDPSRLCFTVALEERASVAIRSPSAEERLAEGRRIYVTRVTLQRMHQQTFRSRVLRAYREQCAICRLRHSELLEAAHILPDGHPRGEPIVPNGLSLCKLHHAAFDKHIVGIRPDLRVEIREDVLEEEDGPMLKHGLQGFKDSKLWVPSSASQSPNREFLAERYEMFKKTG